MVIAVWSAKGGSGTTVVAASLALLAARADPEGSLLVDLAGDGPAVLGLPEPTGPGLADWLGAGARSPDALLRLVVEAGPGAALLPRGGGPLPEVEAGARLDVAADVVDALAGFGGTIVVDAGVLPSGLAAGLVAVADTSLLVLRPCYLALRRALAQERRPDGLVVVVEPGRSLTTGDLAEVLGVPVRAEVPVDPAIARAVDAGLLASRLPRALERGLRRAA